MPIFRIGLPTSLHRKDGSAHFPSYQFGELANRKNVQIDYFESEPVLNKNLISDFDCIVLLGEKLNEDSFPKEGRLTHVARMGVGYDTVNVVLTITPDAVRRPMAVATLCYMLSLTSKLFIKDKITRGGPEGWAQRTQHHGLGLTGRTLGIVGLGNIGSEIARIVKPLDMNIIATDPYISTETGMEQGVTLVDLEKLFCTSDIISLNCPLKEETRHLVNAKLLSLMKPTSFLINTARGPIVDQTALYDALKNRQIAGAALDVQNSEPSQANEPLNTLDNIIMAPHALGWTDEMFANMARINEMDITAILAGNLPKNAVNPEVFEQSGFREKLASRSKNSMII